MISTAIFRLTDQYARLCFMVHGQHGHAPFKIWQFLTRTKRVQGVVFKYARACFTMHGSALGWVGVLLYVRRIRSDSVVTIIHDRSTMHDCAPSWRSSRAASVLLDASVSYICTVVLHGTRPCCHCWCSIIDFFFREIP